jgi:hypothetical protein
MYQLSFIIVVVVVIKFQLLRSRMLASTVRYILERGSLESRLLAVEVPADDGYPFLSKPKYSSDPFVPSERDQGYFSIHEFYRQRYIYVCAKEIAEKSGVAQRTARAHALKLVNLGIFDQAEVFPAHRYRLAETADKRNKGYALRLEQAMSVFGLAA